jgi:hypothetical protein
MSENWENHLQILVASSEQVLKQFFQKHPPEEVIVVGYVFELWNSGPQFDLVANLGIKPHDRHDIRWNSGDYTFPAGLSTHPMNLEPNGH